MIKSFEINFIKKQSRFSGLLYLLIPFLFCLTTALYAQKEYSQWMWADTNFLNFNTVPPSQTVHADFDLWAAIAPACISDKNGNLLFCASGGEIKDKNWNTMAGNALYNVTNYDNYGTRRLRILPQPCNDSIYYIFAYSLATINNNNFNLSYAVVNMNRNGGLGEVVQTKIVLRDSVTFEFEFIRHGNNRDYWLLAWDKTNYREVFSYLISDTGINPIPVPSIVGPIIPNAEMGNADILISPDGEKLILSTGPQSPSVNGPNPTPFMLCQFNNLTGQVSYVCPLEDTVATQDTVVHFGISFSPNSRFLYYNYNLAIVQLDLKHLNYDSIQNSKTHIATNNDHRFVDMQLAMDSNIYITSGTTAWLDTYLHVIDEPDKKGSACHFVLDSILLNQTSELYLPKPVYSIYQHRKIKRDSVECTEDSLLFYFSNERYLDSAHWHIGDTSTAQQFFISDSSAALVIDSAGIYPIMAVSYSGCRLDTFYDTVTVMLTPNPSLGSDTILCEGDTIAISNDWEYSYLWNTGDTTEGIQILQPDTYWLELSNYCGTARDTLVVDSIIQALVIFPREDTLMCDGDTLTLDATVDFGSYLWHDGSTDSIFYATEADTIWAEAQNACGTSSDTISVRFTDLPQIPVLDSILCEGDTHNINLITDSLSTFLWYNGNTSGFDTITTESNYWVEETNLCGNHRDTFFVGFVTTPVIDLGNDTVFCFTSDSVTLNASTRFGSYLWNNGTTDSTFTSHQGLFASDDSAMIFVTVTNACSSVQDSILLVGDAPLSPDLGKDTVVCVNTEMELDPFYYGSAQSALDRVQFLWNDLLDVGSRQYSVSSDTLFSVSVTNTCGTYSSSIQILKDDSLRPFLGNDSNVCFGDSIPLFPISDTNRSDYHRLLFHWNNGLEVGSWQYIVSSDTTIKVSVTNVCETRVSSVKFTKDSLPALIGLDTIRFCEGEAIDFEIEKSDIESLLWMDGNTDWIRTFNQSRIWEVSYFNHCGSTSETIPVLKQLPPDFQVASTVILCDEEVILEPTVSQNRFELYYEWSDGSVANYTYAYETGNYHLTISDEFGCADSATIRVNTCGQDFYAPNSFSPDGDGINDTWDIKTEAMDDYSISIFDRWGNAIFSFRKGEQGWNGLIDNQPAPIGSYTWVLTGSTQRIQYTTEFTGQVVLFR